MPPHSEMIQFKDQNADREMKCTRPELNCLCQRDGSIVFARTFFLNPPLISATYTVFMHVLFACVIFNAAREREFGINC